MRRLPLQTQEEEVRNRRFRLHILAVSTRSWGEFADLVQVGQTRPSLFLPTRNQGDYDRSRLVVRASGRIRPTGKFPSARRLTRRRFRFRQVHNDARDIVMRVVLQCQIDQGVGSGLGAANKSEKLLYLVISHNIGEPIGTKHQPVAGAKAKLMDSPY